ncbi:1-phosphatidylinositol phosphodiesterase-like [Osmerus eperlanus]|uniref:1-phosphatidylinositol phosphodiesterase-like n=1 Tax=Osmerus eperlanus TaxID=29151 RepID=UPI002E1056CC
MKMNGRTFHSKQILCIFLLLLTFYHGCYGTATYFNDRETLEEENLEWMTNINNDIELSKLFIPGTHDSLALYGGFAVECQSWKLETQLKAGVRYFDLRVWNLINRPTKMMLTHGPVIQFKWLSSVFQDMVNFLKDHKYETILIRIKPEVAFTKTVKENTLSLLETLNYNSYVYPDPVAVESQAESPKMKDVRGKIVFLKLKDRFDFGIPYTTTHESGAHKVTEISDKLKMVLENINTKMTTTDTDEQIEKELDLILSYSSGTGMGSWKPWLTPKKIAEDINNQLAENLNALSNKIVLHGILAMDFPGPDLIKIVIDFNKRHLVNKPGTSNGKRSLKRGQA